MKYLLIYLCLILASAGIASREIAPRIFEHSDLKNILEGYINNGYPPEKIGRKKLEIAPEITFDAVLTVTKRGNGHLQVANIKTKVYDLDNDTETYVDGLLNIYLVDIDNDGYKDLVVCGVKEIVAEKGSSVIAYRPELMIWRFYPSKKNFAVPIGIFDPYTKVLNYFQEIPNPEDRIILSEKYHYNLSETLDSIDIQSISFKIPLKVTYGLKMSPSGKMRCILEINGTVFGF